MFLPPHLLEPTTNKLPEVVQQSKIRKKEEFAQAFAPIIVDAVVSAYRESPSNIAEKVRRLVIVWKDRSIFEPSILNAMESGMESAEKEKAANPRAGGRSHLSTNKGANVPAELKGIFAAQQNLNGKLAISTIQYGQSSGEYKNAFESQAAKDQPAPVQAARLSNLLKTLDTAHTAVQGAITARTELISALEQLLQINNTALEGERHRAQELAEKKTAVEARKREVENRILQGLDAEGDSNIHGSTTPTGSPRANANGANDDDDPNRPRTPEMPTPAIEALTPPPAESTYSPPPHHAQPAPLPFATPDLPFTFPQQAQGAYPPAPTPMAAHDLLSSLTAFSANRGVGGGLGALGGGLGFGQAPAQGMEGVVLDNDVMEMLKEEAEKVGK